MSLTNILLTYYQRNIYLALKFHFKYLIEFYHIFVRVATGNFNKTLIDTIRHN